MLAKDILIKAGLEKSTWGAHIIIAERDGGFSEEQQDLSAQWITCACGEVDRYVKFLSSDQGPEDRRLHELGLWFTEHVCNNKFVKAATVLIEIEERSIALLLETA
jgi:hypothetical protein